jgi:hypothetical protein
MNVLQTIKAKIQIKNYQTKIKELREKLKATPASSGEGEFKSLNAAVMKGGKSLESLVKGGLKAKSGRKKNVVKTYATPPVIAQVDSPEPMRFKKF